MGFEADADKTRFDVYFAKDIADALNDAQAAGERVQLDPHTVELVLSYLARHFRLEVTP
jgi:hypothetical protein